MGWALEAQSNWLTRAVAARLRQGVVRQGGGAVVDEAFNPVGRRAGWRLLGSDYPFANPWFRVRRDRIEIAGRGEHTYHTMETAGFVSIVPVTDEGLLLLIRQYRWAVDAWCIETPAGGLHDRQGVLLEEAARRELQEETGATGGLFEQVATFYSAVGRSNDKGHVFLATGVRRSGPPRLEATEAIEQLVLPVAEGMRLARAGGVVDGVSAMTLFLCEGRLRDLGYL